MKDRKQLKLSLPVRYLINVSAILLIWMFAFLLKKAGIITNYWNGILITAGINIILATSLNIGVGYLGQLPLGHAGFMAVGAYSAAIYMKSTPAAELLKAGKDAAVLPYILIAILISALTAGIFGIIIGIPALRLRGDYLAIITLGFGEIIRVVLTNIDSVLGFKLTYGSAGLARIPKFTNWNLCFVVTVLCITLIQVFMKSKQGRAVLAIRDNEIAAESVGINITYYKSLAFVFSAMLAGVAGCLYAGYLGSLYPSTFKFMRSIEILVMVVLGGMGSMLGSVISALVLTVLPELLRSVADYRMLAYSLLLVVMMIFRPEGLMGSYDFSLCNLIEKWANKGAKKEKDASAAEKQEG